MSPAAITLALLRLRGIGAGTVKILWRNCPDMSCLEDVVATLKRLDDSRFRDRSWYPELEEASQFADRVLDQCEAQGIVVLSPGHSDFPARLRCIPNAPLLLFALGNFKCLVDDSVAVIGTREPTNFGLRSASRIARSFAEQSWVVVSGLAEGCDTAGHEGCLAGAGRTVAALAHGFGRIYPASNKNLAERIVAEGGCLVTEYPPGQAPTRGSFVERDRLQSGMSLGVIVIETDIKGGTMHTVRHATEQGRPLAAVLHPEELRSEPKTQGNALLIRERKATPLRDRGDVDNFAINLRQGCVEKNTVTRGGHQVELDIIDEASNFRFGRHPG